MDVQVLGPFSVRLDGQSIVPSAAKPRQILALLVTRAQQVVTVPTLMEEIWGDHIPRSAATTLQTYILHLRRQVRTALLAEQGVDAKKVIATTLGGYRLTVHPSSSDVREFQTLSTHGLKALENGDPHTASLLLRQALELWRGPALVDVPTGRVLSVDLLGLEELRIRVLEQRIEADLMLGRHGSMLAELRMLVARYPMNENLTAHLMTAFYRSGALWRALDAFQALRKTLIDELGVEPSSRLQRLHQAMLSGEPGLSGGALSGAWRTA